MTIKIVILLVYVVIFIALAVLAFWLEAPKIGGCCLIFAIMFAAFMATYKDNTVIHSEYYLPCEIVATNETSTYFGTVDQDKTQIYAVYTGDNEWPEDVPYLLHMDDMGTEDVADDEVLMVWRAG